MAQTYTLDEASQKLGITVSELKRRLQMEWKHVRSFRDGTSLRFRSQDIDELARTLGRGSEPDLVLSDVEMPIAPSKPMPPKPPADDAPLPLAFDEPFDLGGPLEIGQEPPKKTGQSSGKLVKGPNLADAPAVFDDEVFALADDEPPMSRSSSRLAKKGDSDVKLEIETSGDRKKKGSKTDEIDIDDELSLQLDDSASSASRAGPKSSPAGKPPKTGAIKSDENSEFELSLSSDSDDFQLDLNEDDEVDLGTMPVKRDGSRAGDSGINLSAVADSGISLEKAGSDDEIDFELNLDAVSASSTGILSKSSRNLSSESDSEFELSLDDPPSSKKMGDSATQAFEASDGGDIFETDFEIPALGDESNSEALALGDADTDLESAEFEVHSDAPNEESGSQVVALDADEAPAKKKKKKKRTDDEDEDEVSFDDMELDDSISASRALRGISALDTDDDVEEDESDEPRNVVTVEAGQAPWGVLPALVMLPCVMVMFVVGLMSYELLRGMWGYHQPVPPTSMVTEAIAGMFTDDLPKK